VRGAADGALISAARLAPDWLPATSALVRGFPAHLIVGLVGEVGERDALAASLRLGQVGVRSLVDLRSPDGWRNFRTAFQTEGRPDQFIRQALVSILGEVGVTESCEPEGRTQFFRLAFAKGITSAKELASALGVHPSTLMSRFFRAGVPSPKRYVAHARMVWAAHLGESTAMSIAAIANRLNASSPQSFHRTVRTMMGMSAAEFRRSFTGASMLDCYRARLVTPYRERLRSFDPLAEWTTGVRSARLGADSHASRERAEQGRAA
jgi:AraC-like DNA-binding protein